MAWVKRTFDCAECGARVTRKVRTNAVWRCVPCGIACMVSSVKQMHERSGPSWDAWQASNGPRGRPRTRSRED